MSVSIGSLGEATDNRSGLLESDDAGAPKIDILRSRHLNELLGETGFDRPPGDAADLEAEGFSAALEQPIGMLFVHSAQHLPALNLGNDREGYRLSAIFSDVIRRMLG